MRLSNSPNCFLACALLLLFISGCRFWQNTDSTNVSQVPEIKSEFPFSTKEPENFTVEIVVSTSGIERKTLMVRSGAKRRYDYDAGEENQRTVIVSDKTYVLFPAKKVYTDDAGDQSADDPLSDPFAWLYAKPEVAVETLGVQDGLMKYLVRLAKSNSSEICIYVDESIGLPVKQEFFSVIGETRTLQYIMELRNFRPEVDESAFEVPKDLRRVSFEEFQRLSSR
jgi:hypothetical protein